MPLTPELLRLTGMLGALWQVIAGVISLTYLVLDGHFGNHHALQMALQRNLHLISSCDAMPLCTSLTSAPMPGGGPIANLAARWITTTYQGNTSRGTTVEGHIQTRTTPGQLLHKGSHSR